MIINRHHLLAPIQIVDMQLGMPKNYKQKCIDEIYKIGNSLDVPSNVYGIRSTFDIWEETKVLNPLLNKIQNVTSELYKETFKNRKFPISAAWSIIYKKGHYAKPHIHLPNSWAFVYYLKSSGATPIVFNDIDFSIHPKDDMLIIFPSILTHSVPPHEEDEDRICVAGNIDAVDHIIK